VSKHIKICSDFIDRLLVATDPRLIEACLQHGSGAVDFAAFFMHPREVVVRIAIGGISFNRSLVQFDGLIQIALLGVFLGKAVETERVVRLGLEHFLQTCDAIVHAAIPCLSLPRPRTPAGWYPVDMIPWHESMMRILLVVLLLLASCFVIACKSTPRADRQPAVPIEQSVRVTQHVGGTHYRVLRHENVLYQTFGPELLVLEPRSNRLMRRVELGVIGQSGSAVDMLIHGERLYVVLDRDEVVELSLSDPEVPRVLSRESAGGLGILPRRLSVADGHLLVSGIGGVVRWDDGFIMLQQAGDVSRVSESGEGLVACIGRRIYRLSDGSYAGSASELLRAEGLRHAPLRSLVFVRQAETGALVGLMSANLREIDVNDATVAVPGVVRSIRIFDHAIWVVTDGEILSFQVMRDGSAGESGIRLVRHVDIDVIGARDVAKVDDDHLAIVGSFGRSLYRMRSTGRGPGDTFVYAHREPSRLMQARSDGRHILAGGPEGSWLYQIGSHVQVAEEMNPDDATTPQRTANTIDARASISDDGRTLVVEADSRTFEYRELGPGGIESRLHTVVSVEGEFWLGHDDGMTVLAIPAIPPRPTGSVTRAMATVDELKIAGRLRLDGPVRHLFPLRVDRGVSFVSRYGGFGIARYAEDRPADTP
jgi:hypothetical protein